MLNKLTENEDTTIFVTGYVRGCLMTAYGATVNEKVCIMVTRGVRCLSTMERVW